MTPDLNRADVFPSIVYKPFMNAYVDLGTIITADVTPVNSTPFNTAKHAEEVIFAAVVSGGGSLALQESATQNGTYITLATITANTAQVVQKTQPWLRLHAVGDAILACTYGGLILR